LLVRVLPVEPDAPDPRLRHTFERDSAFPVVAAHGEDFAVHDAAWMVLQAHDRLARLWRRQRRNSPAAAHVGVEAVPRVIAPAQPPVRPIEPRRRLALVEPLECIAVA